MKKIFLFLALAMTIVCNAQNDISALRKKAAKGDASAQTALGDKYDKGIDVEQDSKEAMKWYLLAAEQGYARAQFEICRLFYNGRGVDKDDTQVQLWRLRLEKAATDGNAEAQFILGRIYHYGLFLIENNKEKGIEWYRKAAEQGNAKAQFELGKSYYRGDFFNGIKENYPEAFKWYIMSAQQGFAPAQHMISRMYYKGESVEKNEKEAMKWFQKMEKNAKKGDIDAQRILGTIYDSGEGFWEKDISKAKKWYRMAAEQGDLYAQHMLASIFEEEDNYAEVLKWYSMAAKQGSVEAQMYLGDFYSDGEWVEKKYEEAKKWYLMAAKAGDVNAQIDLGDLYYEEKDYTEAIKWYSKAAEKGNTNSWSSDGVIAWCSLGNCHYDLSQYAEAVKWFRMAAEKGSQTAQCNLGLCYEQGLGVERNPQMAVEWYRKSAEDGDAWAQCKLGHCYLEGIGVDKDTAVAKEWLRKASNVWFHKASDESTIEAKRILEELDVAANKNNPSKPKIFILSPSDGTQYSNGTIELRIKTISSLEATLYVEINHSVPKTLSPIQNKSAKMAEGLQYRISGLPITPGQEVILTFYCRDKNGNESEKKELSLFCARDAVKPTLHLFAVGVSEYTSKDITRLNYAAKDARDFCEAIERVYSDEDFSKMEKRHIYLDRDATRENINNGLDSLLQEVQPNDMVMFFFSGHGVQDGDETFFMTVNASPVVPDKDGITFTDLRNTMDDLVKQNIKVVTFMDACHAGAMAGAKGTAPKFTEIKVDNALVFYSCAKGEKSIEDKNLKNGVFTAALVCGLNGDAADDGYITVNSLINYIQRFVGNHTDYAQSPWCTSSSCPGISLLFSIK